MNPINDVPEARTVESPAGKFAEGEGWYVLNAAEARWHQNEKFGVSCGFEGDVEFPQYGINIHVLQPGQPNCHFHGEGEQEDFLVLEGECLLIIEDQERLLKKWDFVHCPAWARHLFVGQGDGPCVILMVGTRGEGGVIYPINETARRFGGCPAQETDSAKESYEGCPDWSPSKAPAPFDSV